MQIELELTAEIITNAFVTRFQEQKTEWNRCEIIVPLDMLFYNCDIDVFVFSTVVSIYFILLSVLIKIQGTALILSPHT